MSVIETRVEAPVARTRWRSSDPQLLTVSELGALAVAGGITVIGTVGLAAADLGIFSGLSVAIGTLIVVAVLAFVMLRIGLPRIVLDRLGLVIAVVAACIAAFMFLPGFPYGAGDRDPGVYMEVGASIARTGHLGIISSPLADPSLPFQPTTPSALLTGLWIDPSHAGFIVPQFYHMWSALLGVGYLLHHFGGEANLTPAIGVVCVVLAVLIGQRLGGPIVAALTGVLLSTNMMQVWQAKYPSTEIFAQMLFLAALLSVMIAIQARSRGAALAGGIFIGAGFVARPDGILVVGLALGVLCLLWITRRFDARATAFLVGLVVVSIFATYQAYFWEGAYTNGTLPSAKEIFGALGAMVLVSLALRPLARPLLPRLDGWLVSSTVQRRVGMLLVGLYSLLFCFALARPLFETDTTLYSHRLIRTYDERSLYWLSWFFTWPGLVLALVGVAVLVLRKWTAHSWIVLFPVLALLPLYLWHALNSPYLMWWGRRFIPISVPSLILLISVALGAAWGLSKSPLGRTLKAGSVICALFLTGVFLSQSLPLRSHHEMSGAYQVVTDMAALSGTQKGVYLWEMGGSTSPPALFAGPLWLYGGDDSLNLPSNHALTKQWVSAYVDHYSDRPVFLVFPGDKVPDDIQAQLTDFTLKPVQRQLKTVPVWQTSAGSRPRSALAQPVDFTVYRVTRT